MSAPNPNEIPKIHPQQIFIKLVLDSQNNLNKIVAMQEQQMVYINTMFKNIIDDESATSGQEQQQQQQQQQQQSTNPQVSTGTIKSSEAGTDTES